MELADFFAIDRLSQHDEELLIESAMRIRHPRDQDQAGYSER